MHKKNNTRCGYVALIGAPNAGKSTLLNALIGSKISIVTPKPQTTRGLIRGIAQEEGSQIIFTDTPGIFDAKPDFEKAMVSAAMSGADEADQRMLIVDAAKGFDDDTRRIVEMIKQRGKSVILVLNKVDAVEKKNLPMLAKELYDAFDFEQSFMISALKNNGVKDILRYLAPRLPEAPFLFPDDEATDMNERDIAAEITREQCFLKLHAELPYSLMVQTEKWEEKMIAGVRNIRINQVIHVERESHKKIVLGKSGAMLKLIGSIARRIIGEALGAQVHLFLFVKVDEKWKQSAEGYKSAGLEYKK